MLDVCMYFLLFIIYSFIGWLMETVFTLVKDKMFSNRGFLIGPVCPIYGVGAILIVFLLRDYSSRPVGLFVLSMVICSILEYFTSYMMEKLFKARWWDYSDRKYNINGRICLETMVPFGLFSCFLVYVVNPFFVNGLSAFSSSVLYILFIFVLIIFLFDMIVSLNVVNNFKSTIKIASMEDRTEDINNYIHKLILRKSIFHRRLLKAFPRLKSIKMKIKKD